MRIHAIQAMVELEETVKLFCVERLELEEKDAEDVASDTLQFMDLRLDFERIAE